MSDFSTSDDPGDAGSPAPGLISSASAPNRSHVTAAWAESSEAQSEPPTPPAPAEPIHHSTIVLSAIESRVLGSLIEKSFLTPDVYPMTTNGLATACNQKTNRDPVVNFSAVEIDGALLELRQRNLVRRVHEQGARSTKHRQTLDEALSLDHRQLALLSVLMLRGPQTLGELRLRTERHDLGFEDLESVEACLEALGGRGTPLVRELARQPGQKENRWQHLLADPDEEASTEPAAPPAPVSSASPGGASATQSAASTPASPDLADRIGALEELVATLQRQLGSLAAKLGEPLE